VHDGRVPRPLVAVALAAALLTAACGTTDPSVRADQRDRPVVVAGLTPLAELARTVGGDDVVVIDLTPVGESAHELTLTPREETEVRDADLVIDIGGGMQPAVTRASARRRGPTVDVLDALDLPDRAGGATGPPDPHVWMDPTIMGSIATLVGDAIASLVPDHAKAVKDRAQNVVEDDVRLDAQLARGLRACRHTILATQHDAFGWFAARYGLTTLPLDATIPDDDPAPDAARVRALLPHLDDGSVTTLFTDPLSPTGWMEVLAEEHGVDTSYLDPYEGSTLEAEAHRATYRKVLLNDLRTLQDDLDCAS
jgi:zinc transport system substrate-binding protein